MITLALTILGLPLLAFLLIVFVTRRSKMFSAAIAIFAMAIATVLAFVVFSQVMAGQTASLEINWLRLYPGNQPTVNGIQTWLPLGIAVDSLTAVMLIDALSTALAVGSLEGAGGEIAISAAEPLDGSTSGARLRR